MILKLNLENCHGIKTLNKELSFGNNPIIIYAPNGTFKTSLCKTFNDINEGVESKDNVADVVGTTLGRR